MNRAKPEDDEYWNSSKFKAFTFEDDDDEFTKVNIASGKMICFEESIEKSYCVSGVKQSQGRCVQASWPLIHGRVQFLVSWD